MTTYRTIVIELPASPLGLLPACWTTEHWCTLCHHEVATQDLITHAQAHTDDEPHNDA